MPTVAILGSAGYTGQETLDRVLYHPGLELVALGSDTLAGKPAPVIDGLTGDQRFFLGFAQIWARKHREADLKNRLTVDPHPPAEYRVNGTVRNVPAFYSAFAVKEGDKMFLPPAERVRIW
jgi:putative endopeptidase